MASSSSPLSQGRLGTLKSLNSNSELSTQTTHTTHSTRIDPTTPSAELDTYNNGSRFSTAILLPSLSTNQQQPQQSQPPPTNSSLFLKYPHPMMETSDSSLYRSVLDSLVDENCCSNGSSISCGSNIDQEGEDEFIATTTTTVESEDGINDEIIEYMSLPKLPSLTTLTKEKEDEKIIESKETNIQNETVQSQQFKKHSPRSTWMISKHLSFTSVQHEMTLNTSTQPTSNDPNLEMKEISNSPSTSSVIEIPTIITDQASHSSSSLSLKRASSLIQHPNSNLLTYSKSSNSIQSASKINIHTLSESSFKVIPKKGKVVPDYEEVESINSSSDTPKPARIFHQSSKFYRVSSFSSIGTDSTTTSQKLRSKTTSFNSNQYVNLQKKGKPILKKSKSSSACFYAPRPLTSEEAAENQKKIYFNEQVQIREFRTLYEGRSRRMYRFSFWSRNIVAHVSLLLCFTILFFAFIVLFIFGNSIQITCDTDYMKYFLLSDSLNCLSFALFFIFLIIFQCREGKRRRLSKRSKSNHPQKSKSKKKPVVKKEHKFVHQDSFSLYRNLFSTSISLEPLKDEESSPSGTTDSPVTSSSSSKFKLSPFAKTMIGIVSWIVLHVWGLASIVSVIDAGTCVTGIGLVYYIPNMLHFTVMLLLSISEIIIIFASILRY
ncbi:hypothetical protein FDP41_002078 [Naegleria fowleri]|uniref:Uncharacterized protein n=1 Tax=Naegleria fowleri TaxID=5763 RepID=A0A6A5BZB9_NAEFO|nr:uncharacterized protein FDP41_002078 [Naegleria fowleri]KAF0979008.1 hypothetical protein FDP41_002078 [Naegleria fowleri]